MAEQFRLTEYRGLRLVGEGNLSNDLSPRVVICNGIIYTAMGPHIIDELPLSRKAEEECIYYIEQGGNRGQISSQFAKGLKQMVQRAIAG